MINEACCTCAKSLSFLAPHFNEKTEKPKAQDRRLDCCGRIICSACIDSNSRFNNYCPFCQITSGPSALPQGLYDPPEYSPPDNAQAFHEKKQRLQDEDDPPPYSATIVINPHEERGNDQDLAQDVLHYLDPSQDTIQSLGLRYGVPPEALRRKNGLFADHLLAARKSIIIPGEFYKGGVSLSPEPVDGEEEEARKAKIRRFMVACKVSDYDVAVLYLEQAKQDLDMAVEAYLADEKWEAENPMARNSKGKNSKAPPKKRFGISGGLTGQL